MTRHRTQISARRRRLISLTVVLALVTGALMPLAQAMAGSAGSGALLAAICSPNGIHYVEIDLGQPDAETPPNLGTLDHCPGCLGSVSAVLPAVADLSPRPVDDPAVLEPAEQATAPLSFVSFQPRAPPVTS